MDDVFNTSGSISPKQSEVMDKEEEHIRRRIEEFKRAEDEKQRTVVTESHSTRQIFDPSSISMDDVFNSPQSQEKSSVGIGHSGPTTVSTVNATETDKDTINLKSMFVPEDNQKHPGEEEELKHIQKRIEEFKEAEEQKHVHLVTNEDHPVLHSFDASKISLEDIFGAQKTPKIGDEKPSETSSASITMRPPKVEDNVAPPETDTKEDAENQTPAISINLESVFVTGTSRNIEKDNSDEKIRRDIVEFERSKQEKDIQRYGTADFSSSRRQILNESEISMDDVFSSEHKTAHGQKPVKSTSQISMSSQNPEISLPVNEARDDPLERTSNASIDLDKVFVEGSAGKSDVDASDERIRRGIAEFERSLQEKEAQRTGTTSTVSSARKVFSDSIISMEDVFNPEKKKSEVQVEEPVTPCASDETGNFNHPDYSLTSTKDSTTTTKTTTRTETETDRTSRRVYGFKPSPEEPKIVVSTGTVNLGVESLFEEHNEPVISTVGINLDDVFGEELKNRTNGDQDVREFNENIGFTSSVSSIRMRTSEEQKTVSSEVGKSEEDSVSVPRNDEKKNENRTSAVSIDLEKVFVEGSAGKSYFDASDEKIRRGIAEFERAKQEKEAQKAGVVMTTHSNMHLFDESDISMDDVFNTSKPKQDSITERKYPDEEATATIGLSETPKESTSFDLDKVSVSNVHQEYSSVDDEARHIEKRIKEFKKAEEEQQTQRITESHSHHRIFDDSNISMDDVFNTSGSISLKQSEVMDKEEEHIRRRIEEFKRAEEEKQRTVVTESHSTHHIFDPSSISMDDVFNKTTDSGCEKTTSDTEKTTTTTTTRTETTSESYSKKTVRTLDDLFGPQTATPPTISISAISLDQPSSSPIAPPRKHQNLSSLFVPGKWNESMMSNASTISLDDSFDNSFVKSGNSQVNEPKMRKPLTLPVDNWIDDLVSTVTDEATREAPKTPKSAIDNYYRSPTRISQEIKYEWVAKLIEDDGGKDHQEEIEEHQSEEEHLQKQDNTWVSSVVYRPTLETSAYTLRSSQAEPEQRAEIDMDRVFNNCLMGKKDDDEECECSACRLTEHELEEMKNRKIESENKTRQWRESASHDSEEHRNVIVTNPSQFSIETIFNPDVPLRVETHDAPAPSTSSPPLQSTRTYYISPKVSETVTTTHQWKDADISLDEIFSPVSSTTNENRRFSNFYEDRSGWDTIGSEDSGVMSGGDRGRRRSTRITDHVIDEAFKGIFDSQPSTSSAAPQPEQSDAQYDDYYITSLHQEDIRSSDSEVDPENLDVSQFVDDILGKSMDEAAFLSSTKSLRDHTDTSIDRKKSSEKMHSYYRTRTDTSMDRRVKPDVIKEDFETAETHSNDELLKLVFVDPSDPSISKSDSRKSLTLPRSRSFTKPSDEELLEIEIKPDYFVIKGSYSLLIPKSDPLGHMLQKLREQNNGLATLDFSLTRKLKKLLVNCIRERAGCLDMSSVSSKYEGLLSSRGQSLIESIDHASATFLKMNVDKYEPTRNPNGVVNFCTAENNICTPLLEERFKHLELFFPNTEHLVRYPPAGGWPEAREILVKYFKEFMGARVTVDELALTPSTRTGYDVTSYCLFEADDILLTNGPVYTGTISNVNEKAQCHVACVETDLANPRLDVKMYEAELNRQIEQENTVSGVIIVNPHNPLGVTFPPEEVVNLCNWAASKNLHVVIDEVFANCVFDKPNSKFRPFLSYRHRVHRPENVAWLWSVSKDFGLPGLKFAVIHSANEGLRQAATKLQMYYPCSPFVQDFAINLLSDSDWLREFHAEVNRRISIHYRYTAENLERLEIPFVPAQAGIFVFADFSKYLSTVDFAGELELFERLASAGVMLTPGVHQKCHVFGWFRIVFACTKEELEEGFRRLFVHLGSHLHPIGTVQYDN